METLLFLYSDHLIPKTLKQALGEVFSKGGICVSTVQAMEALSEEVSLYCSLLCRDTLDMNLFRDSKYAKGFVNQIPSTFTTVS